jgi:nicotinate-nucleotide adenylyltransferase
VAEPLGFDVWDFEVKQGGDSFTYHTLEEATRLGASRERLFWLVGADAYAGLARWKKPDRIRELATLLVVGRPGTVTSSVDARDLPLEIPPHTASSTALRAELAEGNASSPLLPAPLRAELGNLLLPRANPYARK